MLMIAEKTPTTSKVTPLIGKFFIASMVIIGLSLIATCVVLNLYECTRAVDSVPKPIRVVILEYLAPLLRVDPPIQKRHVHPPSCSDRANQYAVDTVSTTVGTAVVGSTEAVVTGTANWNFHEPNFFKINNNNNNKNNNLDNNTNDRHNTRDEGRGNDCRQRKETEVLPKEISEGIAVLSERAKQQEKFDELTEEWQAVAKVADRFFLIVFLFTIAIATTYLFVNRPSPDDL